ncbi:response regulator [Teredinibacter turnerae]|uniref:response regulator n=1 Tax=Teredinibacter turnerae TaxID=2426 RepID=UPI000425DAE2|nr:response regulator [Teredinibacter turnerae]
MLTAAECKVVLATVTQRRAWLLKQLDTSTLDDKTREEHMEMIKLLDSVIKKLASAIQRATPAPKPRPKPVPKRTAITMENLRVLIAEDNADSAELLIDVLGDFGVKNIVHAEDGMAAFDKIKTSPFDLILCDWDMPHINGLDVYKKAKASNTLQGAHFIMVTAVSEAARIKEAVQLGINDYIVKPVDIDALEAKIRAAFNMAAADNEEPAS